jgi:hypothetical protein
MVLILAIYLVLLAYQIQPSSFLFSIILLVSLPHHLTVAL